MNNKPKEPVRIINEVAIPGMNEMGLDSNVNSPEICLICGNIKTKCTCKK